ncbi:MAG: cytidylate kinase-like family protein [Desulfosalsimonadaceae bacterium]|nr:cytidylate kinase-like family protein [Desulfosalsimonadaceae bacterium]
MTGSKGKAAKDTERDIETYWKGRRKISQLAMEYVSQINPDDIRRKMEKLNVEIFPAICFSRNIGVGALALAEIVGKNMNRRVIDRQIIEYISNETELSRESIQTFDERRPGRLKEILCLVLGDRAFDLTDYARHLFITAFFLAHTEETVFVGRGIHLMLPRSKVFAVRCVGSIELRVKNIAKKLAVDEKKAKQIILQADQEQAEFFHKAHGKTSAPAQEFDMVLNFDYIKDMDAAARAIETLYRNRFQG